MIAFVFLVICFSILDVSIKCVSSSISTNLGTAFARIIEEAVATAVFETVKTSSPFLMPQDRRAMCNASVPLFTPIAYLVPINLANSFSKKPTSFPKI